VQSVASSSSSGSVSNAVLSSSTSLITINSDPPTPQHHQPLPPQAQHLVLPNSLESVSQITVVTSTHPPVIIDNSVVTPQNEVIIVSNDLNKSTHLHESSTDDDFPSLDDSLGDASTPPHKQSSMILAVNEPAGIVPAPPPQPQTASTVHARKLDESEVLIVSPSYADDDSAYNTASGSHSHDPRDQLTNTKTAEAHTHAHTRTALFCLRL